MPLISNAFDTGVVTALCGAIRGYLSALGVSDMPAVVEQATTGVQALPLVVVSATELEEMVYQTGNYRVAVEVGLRVDMDAGGSEQLRLLSGALLDCLQQVDLVAQLNALKDDTGRVLCIVQGLVLEQSRLEDIGDRQWRRVYALNVFGCSSAG